MTDALKAFLATHYWDVDAQEWRRQGPPRPKLLEVTRYPWRRVPSHLAEDGADATLCGRPIAAFLRAGYAVWPVAKPNICHRCLAEWVRA